MTRKSTKMPILRQPVEMQNIPEKIILPQDKFIYLTSQVNSIGKINVLQYLNK